jgi:hypothetical protein
MLHMIEKNGKPFGYADERQISKHGLKLYVAHVNISPVIELAASVDTPEPEAPRTPIRKAK